jgi:ABC-type transport system involved in multi-copper enzyme maturation permease subunit
LRGFYPMSFFADREMIVSGFTIGAISILAGFTLRFTHVTRLDHFIAYVLVAAGVLLVFASSLARKSKRNIVLLRYLLATLVVLVLIGVLTRDMLQRLF